MAQKQQTNQFLLILILGLLTTIGPFSIDMYLPAFADIAKSLNTDISHISLSLSTFFIGLGFGQLIYGPLLERYGRKKPMYIGLGLYILSSLGCAMATSVDNLIIFRFFQAVGSCGGLVASRAIVRDLFEAKDMARIFSLLMMVVAISPIVAPTVGGYVTAGLGWRYVFIILMIIAALILVLSILFLPESKKPDPAHSLKFRSIYSNYKSIFKHPQFILYVITGSISYAGLIAYISGSAFLYMDLLRVSETQFGWIFAIIAAGLIGANQLNTLMLKVYTSERIVLTSLVVQSIVGGVLLFTIYTGQTGMYLTTFLIFSYMTCLGFVFPNSSALSLAPLGHNAGNASALMGSLQTIIGALASALVGLLQNDSAMPMAVIMSLCAIMAWQLLRVGSRKLSLTSFGTP
ncbi:MAG: multidrug effflux MFS transporter [Cyclobacteriaceae bacterium]|nr:multidrug effflux MFS transporter [Cyclobacteriaceae bacterium]